MADEENDLESLVDDATADADEDAEADLESLVSESAEGVAAEATGDLSSLVTGDSDDEDADVDSLLASTDDDVVPSGGGLGLPESSSGNVDLSFLLDMPLTVTFEVGRAKMNISDLLSLGQGSVLELHRLVGEDLDMFVNGKLVARGEVVVINEKFGARLTSVVPPEERIKRMGVMDHI